MKIIKGLFFSIISVIGLFIYGCENANNIRTATFSNITAYGSDKNTIKVSFERDDRVNDKYFDIQIRVSEEIKLNIAEEMKESLEIDISGTRWNSLTTLMVNASGAPDTEEFAIYKEVQSKTYIITAPKEVYITFRVVVGEAEENSKKTGYILSNSKEISEEYKVKLTKLKQ